MPPVVDISLFSQDGMDVPEKSHEELIDEIRSLRAQLAALEAGAVCWGGKRSPCVAQQRLAGILTIADDAIISADSEHRITFFNQGAERIFQYSAEEVLGKPIHILLPERFREEHARFLDAFVAGDASSTRLGEQGREIVGLRKDGTEFSAEGSASRIVVGSRVVLTCIVRDTTERRRVEVALAQARDQAIKASQVKSAFLANMSHEIRTPMNGVTGMIELLMETPLNEVQREYAQIIYDSAQSLLTLINDILDFSKIEANKVQLEIIDFEPLALVEGVAELLAAKAREKGLSLMTYIDPALPPTLRGDPVRLRQILINLGDNAIKFTEQGEVVIQASLQGQHEDTVVVEFSVRDTGIGISEECRQVLFQPFVQADDSTTRRFGGTGLGLSISKRLVDLMGGHIDVESAPGEGSRFWFRVPLEAGRSVPATSEPIPNLSGLRVLIVDDNQTACEILHKYLESWGIENESATGGAAAMDMLRQAVREGRPYDIAIVDLCMPEHDGLELARWIRSDSSLDGVRLILLTAFDAHGRGEEALRFGFSAYMTKPVKQSHLFDCIMNVIQESKESTPALQEPPAPVAPPCHAAVRDCRVLLVEDNPVNQRVVLLLLQHLGYAADVVGTGKGALRALAEVDYDLILMDCQMPEMDGFQATRLIRKAEATKGRRIPIVALTANAMQGDRERCIGAGMDDYISKPVSPKELREVLERWIPVDRREKGAANGAVESGSKGAANRPGAIDLDALYATYGYNEGTISQLLELYLSTTPKLITRATEAVEARKAEEARSAAHEIKGSSNMIGAYEMGEASLALEEAAETGDWVRANEALARLVKAYARAEEFARSHLDRSEPPTGC